MQLIGIDQPSASFSESRNIGEAVAGGSKGIFVAVARQILLKTQSKRTLIHAARDVEDGSDLGFKRGHAQS